MRRVSHDMALINPAWECGRHLCPQKPAGNRALCHDWLFLFYQNARTHAQGRVHQYAGNGHLLPVFYHMPEQQSQFHRDRLTRRWRSLNWAVLVQLLPPYMDKVRTTTLELINQLWNV